MRVVSSQKHRLKSVPRSYKISSLQLAWNRLQPVRSTFSAPSLACPLGALLLLVCLTGCEKHVEEYTRPDQVMDFQALFNGNCVACHGAEGKNGAAQTLNDPIFQHQIGPDQLRKNITQGVAG